jgi:predicted nucleic acid-binding protein
MTVTLVDSNVLLDVATEDPQWSRWSKRALIDAAFVNYRRRGGARVTPLPDFYIGAHAAVAGYRLLTRDVARYRTYFPTVILMTPR